MLVVLCWSFVNLENNDEPLCLKHIVTTIERGVVLGRTTGYRLGFHPVSSGGSFYSVSSPLLRPVESVISARDKRVYVIPQFVAT